MQMKCVIVAEPGTVGTAELDAETAKCYSSEDRKRLKKEGETQVAQVSYAHHAAGTELCADPDEHAVSTQTSCGPLGALVVRFVVVFAHTSLSVRRLPAPHLSTLVNYS